MKLHIANYQDADRRTATATEAMTEGMVVVAWGVAGGRRNVKKAANGDTLVSGSTGVVMKVTDDATEVSDSTAPVAPFGSRIATIVSGDLVTEVRRGAILLYDVALLHASLTAANVVPGEALGVVGSLFCKAATGSAITTPVVGRVFGVVNGQIQIELVL